MDNRIKTTLFLGLLTCLLIFIGRMIGGQQGMVLFFGLAVIMNVGAYWFSDKIVLRLYRAQPVPSGHPIHELVARLCRKATIPLPRVYSIPSSALNAFATGRNPSHAAVAVTEGLYRVLTEEELEGVLAHELSHVRNRDTLISCVAATIAGAIMMIANAAKWAAIFGGFGRHHDDNQRGGGALELLFLAIVAPLAATLIQMAISRSREYLADSSGARLVGQPYGLAKALKKISEGGPALPANAATSHLFIVNPLSGRSLLSLFSTHPPVEERIRRLTGGRMI